MSAQIERFVPPGGSPEQLIKLPAPDINVGGFLDEFSGETLSPEVMVPINASTGRPMSPIETATSVPLPIIGKLGRETNKHHAHFYEHTYSEGTDGQQAVRHSRLQRVGTYVHMQYHRNFHGTAFPETPENEYELTVLNCAGYIPNHGVKIEKREVSIARLSMKEKDSLRGTNVFSQENDLTISRFLLDYALEQDFNAMMQLDIEEFLTLTTDKITDNEVLYNRKLRLAERLTNTAIGMAVDPIYPVYAEAKKTEMLRDGMPSSAWDVVRKQVEWIIPQYFDRLEDKIATQFSV